MKRSAPTELSSTSGDRARRPLSRPEGRAGADAGPARGRGPRVADQWICSRTRSSRSSRLLTVLAAGGGRPAAARAPVRDGPHAARRDHRVRPVRTAVLGDARRERRGHRRGRPVRPAGAGDHAGAAGRDGLPGAGRGAGPGRLGAPAVRVVAADRPAPPGPAGTARSSGSRSGTVSAGRCAGAGGPTGPAAETRPGGSSWPARSPPRWTRAGSPSSSSARCCPPGGTCCRRSSSPSSAGCRTGPRRRRGPRSRRLLVAELGRPVGEVFATVSAGAAGRGERGPGAHRDARLRRGGRAQGPAGRHRPGGRA